MQGNCKFNLPIFLRWAHQQIEGYRSVFSTDFDRNPNSPPRKGIPPGKNYPFSLAKFEAATMSLAYGCLKHFTLEDVLGSMNNNPALGLLKKWRTEGDFKAEVKKLRGAFSAYMASNIVVGSAEFLPFLDPPFKDSRHLIIKAYFIREALAYAPVLLSEICSCTITCLRAQQGHQRISNFIGFYILVLELLVFVERTGPKSRARKAYMPACKKITAQHSKVQFLINYMTENASPSRGIFLKQRWPLHFKDSLKRAEEHLRAGDFSSLIDEYRQEFASIVNSEMLKLAKNQNDLTFDDLKFSVNYLGGKYKFREDGLYQSFDD